MRPIVTCYRPRRDPSYSMHRRSCHWLESRELEPKLLLLTHGHFDHVPDVAKIKRRFDCQIGCHPETAPMISDPDFFRSFGFELETRTGPARFLDRSDACARFSRTEMEVLEVPGHCPGSLCFFSRKDELLIGGDVLFAGWSRPLGFAAWGWRTALPRDQDEIISTRRRRHRAARPRSATTIGAERRTIRLWARTKAFAHQLRKRRDHAAEFPKPAICCTSECRDFIAAGMNRRNFSWPLTSPRKP